jgi:hypothetical protein
MKAACTSRVAGGAGRNIRSTLWLTAPETQRNLAQTEEIDKLNIENETIF